MEDYKYKLSIIIPMYNAEKYIGNCLDSVFGSDLPASSYEVVVVNDGSADKGPEIVAEYIKDHPNLSYYCQENQGQSTARNYGIRVAKGEYVWCVDADDMLDAKCKGIIDLLEAHPGIDILAAKMQDVTEQMERLNMSCLQPTVRHNAVMTGRDAVISGYNPSSICILITRKEFLLDNDLKFVPGITHQDVELSYRMMAKAQSVYFCDIAPYIYIQHPVSVRHDPKRQLKYNMDDIYIIGSFRRLSSSLADNDRELADTIYNRSQNVLWGMVLTMFCKRKERRTSGLNMSLLEELKKQHLYPLRGHYDSIKKRLILPLLNCEKLLR